MKKRKKRRTAGAIAVTEEKVKAAQERNRKNFEVRKSAAVVRMGQEEMKRRMETAERERNMTPGQRKARTKAGIFMASMLGWGMSAGFDGSRRRTKR